MYRVHVYHSPFWYCFNFSLPVYLIMEKHTKNVKYCGSAFKFYHKCSSFCLKISEDTIWKCGE